MDVNDGQYSLDDAMQLDDDSLESAEVDEQDSEQQPQENLDEQDAHQPQDLVQQQEVQQQEVQQQEVQQQELPDLEAIMTASTSLLRQLQWSSLVDAFQVPSGSSLASLFVSQFDAESDTSDEDVEQPQQQPLRHLHCRRCGCTRIPNYLMPAHRYVHRYLQTDGAVIRRVWEIASRAPNVVRTGVLDEYTLNSAISESLGAVEVGVEDVDAVSERCLTGARAGSPLNCPICLEPVRCDARRLVQCEHTFCDACITPWLMQSKKCPLCMSELRL